MEPRAFPASACRRQTRGGGRSVPMNSLRAARRSRRMRLDRRSCRVARRRGGCSPAGPGGRAGRRAVVRAVAGAAGGAQARTRGGAPQGVRHRPRRSRRSASARGRRTRTSGRARSRRSSPSARRRRRLRGRRSGDRRTSSGCRSPARAWPTPSSRTRSTCAPRSVDAGGHRLRALGLHVQQAEHRSRGGTSALRDRLGVRPALPRVDGRRARAHQAVARAPRRPRVRRVRAEAEAAAQLHAEPQLHSHRRPGRHRARAHGRVARCAEVGRPGPRAPSSGGAAAQPRRLLLRGIRVPGSSRRPGSCTSSTRGSTPRARTSGTAASSGTGSMRSRTRSCRTARPCSTSATSGRARSPGRNRVKTTRASIRPARSRATSTCSTAWPRGSRTRRRRPSRPASRLSVTPTRRSGGRSCGAIRHWRPRR